MRASPTAIVATFFALPNRLCCSAFAAAPGQAQPQASATPPSPSAIRKMKSMDDDAADFHSFCSAAVVLSNAHASNGILTVQRSVRDIDNACRQTYLYNIALSPSTSVTAPTIPPNQFHPDILIRVPSPSGNKVAIFKANKPSNGAKHKPAIVLEVWVGAALVNRIDLSANKLHGAIINDASGFGMPVWNDQETMLVYPAERAMPETTGFFAKSTTTTAEATATAASADGNDATNAHKSRDAQSPKQRGAEYELGVGKMEHWGERLSQQSALLDLFVVNVETGNMDRIANVPGVHSKTRTDNGVTLGQASFSPDGRHVAYTGWDAGELGSMPRRLGFIFCYNRASKVYLSSISNLTQRLSRGSNSNAVPSDPQPDGSGDDIADADSKYMEISPSNHRLSRSPTFVVSHGADMSDPNQKGTSAAAGTLNIVYLSNKEGFITHDGCMGLFRVSVDVHSDGTIGDASHPEDPLVPVIQAPSEDITKAVALGLNFPGLFLSQLPQRCQIPRTPYVVFSTLWGSTQKLIRVSTESANDVALIEPTFDDVESSNSLHHLQLSNVMLCMSEEGGLIFSTTGNDQPAIVHMIESQELSKQVDENGVLKCRATTQQEFAPIAATSFSALSSPASNLEYEIVTFTPPSVDGAVDAPIQSILMYPKGANSSKDRKVPLIVVPHGGPHSCSAVGYIPGTAYLCGGGDGYAVLLPNYRGSTGFGQATLESLMTRIGELDVSDVMSSTQHVLDKYDFLDAGKVGICGGSHGGFLTGHCTGQYPEFFKAAVVRNPVTNIASMVTASDIPDWCYAEAMSAYDFGSFRGPTLQEMTAMWQKSPVAHSQNVQTPTLVALGMVDLRVPPSQGIEWYQMLRSKGVPTKLLMYPEDSHALDKVTTEADHWVNIKRWFDEHMGVEQ